MSLCQLNVCARVSVKKICKAVHNMNNNNSFLLNIAHAVENGQRQYPPVYSNLARVLALRLPMRERLAVRQVSYSLSRNISLPPFAGEWREMIDDSPHKDVRIHSCFVNDV